MIVNTSKLNSFYHVKNELEGIVRNLCSEIIVPQDEDKFAFLWALCGKETSFGVQNRPRHEPAFAPGGVYFQASEALRSEYALWGAIASCSLGVTQIMWARAREAGFSGSPYDLFDANFAIPLTCKIMNEGVKRGAFTLEQKAAYWNGGPGALKNRSQDVQNYVSKMMGIYKNYKGAGNVRSS